MCLQWADPNFYIKRSIDFKAISTHIPRCCNMTACYALKYYHSSTDSSTYFTNGQQSDCFSKATATWHGWELDLSESSIYH